MYATGRKPNSTGLGLEALGLELNSEGAIRVNSDYQTNVPSIYALGEVTDRGNLTPVTIAEGAALVNMLYINQPRPVGYDNIPTAVFCQPHGHRLCAMSHRPILIICVALKHRQGDLMRYAGNSLVKKKSSNPVKVRKG